MNADYSNATLLFPRFWDSELSGDRPTKDMFSPFDRSSSCIVGDYVVQFEPNFRLPQELKGDVGRITLDKLASVVFDKVRSDVEGAREALEAISELASSDRVDDNAYFEKDSEGFRFYDYHEGPGPGGVLVELKNISDIVVGDEVAVTLEPVSADAERALRVAPYFGKEELNGPYAWGKTLAEAADRMLQAYNLSEHLQTYSVSK